MRRWKRMTMRLSIERLRWVLITVALLLVVVVAGYIGYGRWRALEAYRRILKKSGATLTHDTNGFTYSQSVQGKTIFTLHAKRATQQGEGKWALHDADLTLYGRLDNHADRIYGKEFEYDEKSGVARALGEVHMDLQAPQVLAGGHAAPAVVEGEEQAGVIHVRTSGLVYLRKLGVAATDEVVEFRYGGLQCTGKGAEFNSGQSTLRLLSDVVMDGTLRGQPVHMVATKADVDRVNNIGTITQPVMTSRGRTGRADLATAYLRKDGSIERAVAAGNVVMRAGTRTITAPMLEAQLNVQNVLETARLQGGVSVVDSDPQRATRGTARQVDAVFNDKGEPASVTATGAARVEMRVPHAGGPSGLVRSMQGEKIVGLFVPAGGSAVRLSEVHATGGARAQGESLATVKGKPQRKQTLITADDLRLGFVPAAGSEKKLQPQQLSGLGHTFLQQDAALNEQQTSAGDSLQMTFHPETEDAGLEIASAVQTGHVVIRSRAADRPETKTVGAISTGVGERAVYDGDSERLVLTGHARLNDATTSLTADAVTFDRTLDVAEARGDVQAMIEGNGANPLGGGAGAKATHIQAASARLAHETKVAEFRGTDVQPARMWQEASQVQAARLVFDGVRKTFSARPEGAGVDIHAVFAGLANGSADGKRAASGQVVRVAAPKMDYSDGQHEAVFSGGVQMQGAAGDVRAQRSVVFLKQEKVGAGTKTSVDRIVVTGSVVMDQPGRRATGEELVYIAATDSFALTGDAARPPRVVDAKQGNVTGTALLFGDRGSTIVVSGDAVEGANSSAKHGRVRTETEVRQSNPK